MHVWGKGNHAIWLKWKVWDGKSRKVCLTLTFPNLNIFLFFQGIKNQPPQEKLGLNCDIKAHIRWALILPGKNVKPLDELTGKTVKSFSLYVCVYARARVCVCVTEKSQITWGWI